MAKWPIKAADYQRILKNEKIWIQDYSYTILYSQESTRLLYKN